MYLLNSSTFADLAARDVDIAVIEVDDGSGVFDDRRSIGRDKEFIVADPE